MAQTTNAKQIIEGVRQAFRSEARLGPRFDLKRIALAEDGALILEGTVTRLKEKSLPCCGLRPFPECRELSIASHVTPVVPSGDKQIRAQVREMFGKDPDFAGLQWREDIAGSAGQPDYRRVAAPGENAIGGIDVAIKDGVVILNGMVPTLARERVAGAMCWWVPGVHDVINGISVDPPEEDGPDQIEEGVRAMLERNPAIDVAQVRIGVRDTVGPLTGLVHSEAMREMAENDAWAVFGVDDVANKITVRL